MHAEIRGGITRVHPAIKLDDRRSGEVQQRAQLVALGGAHRADAVEHDRGRDVARRHRLPAGWSVWLPLRLAGGGWQTWQTSRLVAGCG